MKRTSGIILGGLALSVLVWLSANPSDIMAEEAEMSVDVQAGRYANVNGDVSKFRAHKWMDDGASAGLNNLEYKKLFEDDSSVTLEGRSIPDENDNDFLFLWKKEDVGIMKMHYKSFRKYFDDGGGYYYPFTTALRFNELDRDLEMDMGEVFISYEITSDNAPDLTFEYEHHEKDGEKSRLTWNSVKEGATTRNIGPSHQVLDEESDAVTVKGKTQLAGMDVKAEQRVEYTDIFSMREERSLDGSGSASGNKIRRQWQSINSQALTSKVMGEKWFNNEKSYTSLAYRFHQIELTENETLSEFDQNLNPRLFSSHGKNKPNAHAAADFDSHIWTNMFMTNLSKDLSLTTKVKAEKAQRTGTSLYPSDSNDPPDGIANTFEANSVKNNIYRFGENVSLQYQGFNTFSLYAEGDFEQVRNWLTEKLENQDGTSVASSSGDFERETLTNVQRTIFTLGSRWAPVRWFDMNSQVRHGDEVNDYDDLYETSGGSTARSAFIDELRIETTEFSSKLNWKPTRWLRNGFRYQLLDQTFRPRAQDEEATKSDGLSHVFTYDMALQPLQRWLLNLALSYQEYKITTPAASATTATTPGFSADVKSALLSSSYSLDEKVSLFSSFYCAQTRNFDDFTAIGLPLGADYDAYDITLGVNWKLKDSVSIKPHYSYYKYEPASISAEYEGYTAHVGWLDVALEW